MLWITSLLPMERFAHNTNDAITRDITCNTLFIGVSKKKLYNHPDRRRIPDPQSHLPHGGRHGSNKALLHTMAALVVGEARANQPETWQQWDYTYLLPFG